MKSRRKARLIAVGAAGAVGAALFYFFDPEQGPARRAAARAWVGGMVRKTLDRTLGVPPIVVAEPAEPFPDLVPRVEEEPAPEPAEQEPEPVAVLARTVDMTAEAPGHVGWTGETETGVTFVHGQTGPKPQIISYDAEREEQEQEADEPRTEPQLAVAEPDHVEPARRRWAFPLTATLAAVTAAAAVGLGLWALSLSDSRDTERQASRATSTSQARAIALLSQPGARRIPVKGSKGSIVLVVGRTGRAVLILSGLGRAPAHKTYQAWVVTGKTPKPAGIFAGSSKETVVQLRQAVPKGAIVAVTLEPSGGLAAPSGAILFSAKRA